ncbi:MAG: ester cyclase [Chloroflexales bacterium]|nr:ester cyclase [Chloroflexales bacterium]
MSRMEQMTIADQLIAEFNHGNWDQLAKLLAPDMTYTETGTGRRVTGAEPYIQLLKGWRQVFPDVTGTIDASVLEGATVVQQIAWVGTQAAALPTPSGEVPSQGRRFTIDAIAWYTISGNRVVAMHHYIDMLTMLQQLGAFEPAPVQNTP